MTGTDIRETSSIEETSKIGGTIAELADTVREQMALHQAYVEEARRLVAEGQWQDLCPPDRTRCTGEDRPITLDGNTRYLRCPAADNGCPWLEDRKRLWDAIFLRMLGLPDSPEEAKLPPNIRRTLDLYCRTIAERVRRGEGLVIGGGVGSGKTYTLAWVARAARRAGITEVCYVPSWRAFDELFEGRYERLDWDSPLLLWDDFGTEARTERAMARFHGLVEYRITRRLAVILTTHLSRLELAGDPATERLEARLSERNVWVWIDRDSVRPVVRAADWEEAQP